jgi:periplasmic protein CpxP/Spy
MGIVDTSPKGTPMKTMLRTPRLLGAAILVSAAMAANAAPGGHGPMAGTPMPGHGMMMAHGGPMAGGPMMGGPMGDGSMMMGGMLNRLLDQVNATAEQRAQIKQITDAAAAEMRTRHEAGRAMREQVMTLFAQPTVDANALEALRQQQREMHDSASKRMMNAMVEISRVLTPEQRRQMAEHMKQRSEMMQRHRQERQRIDAAKS